LTAEPDRDEPRLIVGNRRNRLHRVEAYRLRKRIEIATRLLNWRSYQMDDYQMLNPTKSPGIAAALGRKTGTRYTCRMKKILAAQSHDCNLCDSRLPGCPNANRRKSWKVKQVRDT
jgi:hypothetical protein